jgi:glycerate 2-kinase
MHPRELLEQSFMAAIAAADPAKVLAAQLPWPAIRSALASGGKIVVVGAGKAAASMALALEQAFIAQGLSLQQVHGLVVTRYGHALPTEQVRVVEAAHPVPDAAGEHAALEVLQAVQAASNQDHVIALISGGGSSLLSLPVEGVSAADLRQLTQQLLASGAPIQEMNIVRKHLSRIQGGRLAQASKAPLTALIISDVAGDDLSAIASGPCVPDPSTYADALEVLARWQVNPPASIAKHLASGNASNETPKPGDTVFAGVENRLISTARQSLFEAAKVFEAQGIGTLVLGDSITGEARDVAQVLAAMVREARQPNSHFKLPLAILSGGECTVTLRPRAPDAARGRGGRCSEFLLALVQALEAMPGVHALAGDTDGIDGSETNAGAVWTDDMIATAKTKQLNARSYLDRNDGFSFFEALGGLVHTGPTLTNVNDYRAILVL